jgi:hypothetical protein
VLTTNALALLMMNVTVPREKRQEEIVPMKQREENGKIDVLMSSIC